jgi:hypothetical protein
MPRVVTMRDGVVERDERKSETYRDRDGRQEAALDVLPPGAEGTTVALSAAAPAADPAKPNSSGENAGESAVGDTEGDAAATSANASDEAGNRA